VRADRVYRVLLTRGGPAPALLAEPDRVDVVEVVELDSGEVVLFWDALPRDATRLAGRIGADLQALEADEFMTRWSALESVEDPG
jgi:hypothetical protein